MERVFRFGFREKKTLEKKKKKTTVLPTKIVTQSLNTTVRKGASVMKHLRIISEPSVMQCGWCCCVFAGFPVIEVSISAGGDLFFRLCRHGDVQRSCYTAFFSPHYNKLLL